MTAAASLELRPFTARDRDAVRAIACVTAFRNRGHKLVIDDARLFADYWTSYYTEFEPESCFVLARDNEVVGALLGCLDTARFRQVMARRVVPGVVRGLAVHVVRGGRPSTPATRRFAWWLATRSWREAPAVDVTRFPAHYHLNLLQPARGVGGYSALALRFVDFAIAKGAPGLHGQVLDRANGGVWQRLVQEFMAAHPKAAVGATSRESTMARALWGDPTPMVNRAFGFSTADFRRFLEWLRVCRRL